MPALTSEVTALLNETSAARAASDFIEARTLANIGRRAATLFQDGYSARPVAENLYAVVSPAGAVYTVRVSEDPAPFDSYCGCPCFEKWHTCKHLQAIILAIEEGADHDAEVDGRFDLDIYEFANFCGEGRN